MKSRPIKRYSKEDIFKGTIHSAEIEGIFLKENDKKKIWNAFQNGAKTIPL